MQQVTNQIKQLMEQVSDLSQPSVDKKVRNKVVARLEEAWLWSQHLTKPEALAERAALDATAPANACICEPGARDVNCPVHKRVA